VTAPAAPPRPALPAAGTDGASALPGVRRVGGATATPGDSAPVPAAVTPEGEPLLAVGVAPAPTVSALPTVVPGVVVSRGNPGDDSAVRRGGGTTEGRLPTIGDDQTEPAPEVPGPSADTRPLVERFAATPDIATDQQPLGVVLTEDASAETAILALPVPVTVALDPYDPDAPRRAAAYRAAGHEIALQAVNVPALSTPADLATLIDGWHRAFPEAMAILDVPVNGLGANPLLAREFAGMLGSEGYGAIALRDGLDAFLQAARAAGLRAASVYRLIEGGDQSEFTIRRLIDRAAFEALRQPGILIAGSAADRDTMRELTDFALGDGRAGVALAPASAVLSRN
ncbi:MAG: divergent polysaccharide deacetylase family protein, partial [Rhodobacteraceae bacterium]|nr:divergent polysaccharide deacetylase family protein [Paracoccaceae bacterium]